MAAPWDLTVEVDVAEPRIDKGLLCASADGTLWDKTLGSGWWLEPVTKTAMLAPLPVTPEWRTTFSGSYARVQKSDYSLGTPSDWKNLERTAAGDYYLLGHSSATCTVGSYGANQGMYVSFFVPGSETIAEQTVFVCGWGVQGESGSVWLRFRANGQVAVYKGADIVGTYDLEGGLASAGQTKRTPKGVNNETVNVLLIPCRRRSLVVVVSGSGFEHVFSDLDAELTDNDITPAGSFFWNVPQGQACVQVAPLKYKTSATLYSLAQKLRYPPYTGAAFTYLNSFDELGPTPASSTATASLVKSDTTAYTPDGTINTVRIKVAFTGDASGSVGLYATDAYLPATATETDDSGAVDITCNLRSLRFNVPEHGATTGVIEMLDPNGLETLGMEQPAVTGDRPLRIAVAGIDILRGTMKFPRLVESVGANQGSTDALQWDIIDRWQDMIDATMQAAYPFDGLKLTFDGATAGAIQRLLTDYMGYSGTDFLLSENAFTLPYTPGVSAGEWNLLPQRGDTVAQWIERLFSDYAATFYFGWVPTTTAYTFAFLDPADMSATPVLSLYQSPADATAGGVASNLLEYRTVRGEVEIERIRPEANQIIVIGNDLRTGREIVSQYDDAAAQNPTTAPASRPENWSGKVITFTYSDPAITTQAAADRAKDQLADRLATVRVVARWKSELLVDNATDRTLWRGDVVRIYSEGRGSHDDYRIREFSAELVKRDGTAGESLWDCSYTAERV